MNEKLQLRKIRDALCGLCKVAAKATPTELGGTPDMFWPNYTEQEVESSESLDNWDHHEFLVRHEIKLAAALVTEIDAILEENE